MAKKQSVFKTGQLVMDKSNGHFGVVQYTYA